AMGATTNGGAQVLSLRSRLGSEYLAGIFRSPDDLASQVAAAVAVQGVTRHVVDRVLLATSVASAEMESFAKGEEVTSTIGNIAKMIREPGTSRALVLAIDDGERWWSTRLFLLASLLRSLTSVRQIVFCDMVGRFLGMASPSAILDGLAETFPVLDEFRRELRKGEASS